MKTIKEREKREDVDCNTHKIIKIGKTKVHDNLMKSEYLLESIEANSKIAEESH